MYGIGLMVRSPSAKETVWVYLDLLHYPYLVQVADVYSEERLRTSLWCLLSANDSVSVLSQRSPDPLTGNLPR